jgi:hypothetical protein
MSSHEGCRSRHTIKGRLPRGRATVCDTAFHQAAANNAPRRLDPPSPLIGVVKPVCLPSTQHGTPTTTLCAARARTACLEARELYHASAPVLPWPCCQWLDAAAPHCPAKTWRLLPWWCQPDPARACYACITRGIRAKIAKMRDRKPKHPAMIATSRSATPLARTVHVLARAHNGRAAFRLFHPRNVFPHLGDSRTTHPLHHHHWTGSLASIHRPERAGAGRGSTTNLLCASVPGIQQASSAMQYAMQYAAGRHCLPRQQSALLPQCIA